MKQMIAVLVFWLIIGTAHPIMYEYKTEHNEM